MTTPEARARVEIDRLLTAAGSHVCDLKQADIHGARGVAIRELPPAAGHGDADCLRSCVRKAAAAIESKTRTATLTSVESQSLRHCEGLPAALRIRARFGVRPPLPGGTRRLAADSQLMSSA